MSHFITGIIGTSLQENERRVPVHPEHLVSIPADIRGSIFLERGYGELFGVSDKDIMHHGYGIMSRDKLFEDCNLLVLPRPIRDDFTRMRPGTALAGWGLFAFEEEHTQTFIDKRMTLIDFASMFEWNGGEVKGRHLFERNNELAGYAGVLHALSVRGMCGRYGQQLKALVITYGSVGRGAVSALQAAGIYDVTVIVSRNPADIPIRHDNVTYSQYTRQNNTITILNDSHDLSSLLSISDVIVNAIRQDTDHPVMYLEDGDEVSLKQGALIVDISCDRGMGFPFARPTTFDQPVFTVGPAYYYGVNHTPTYFWNSASWEISHALYPHIESLASGVEGWKRNEVISHAIDIHDGAILNRRILSYQNRMPEYPHRKLTDQ